MEGAEKFVRSYYVTLRTNPYDLYLYFREDCTMARIDGDKQVTAKSGLKIMELLGSLEYMEFDIKSVHSSEPFKDGFIVTVLGSIRTRTSKEPRKFMETFVLTLKKYKCKYRFHSDVFQYVEKHPDVVFHVPSKEGEVAQKQAVPTALRAEQPTLEVASSDGVASVNSGEDNKLHTGNLPKIYDKAKITELVKEVASPVSRERAVSTAKRAEPPTVKVASSDGVASVNSGEDNKLHTGNLPKRNDKTKVTELVKEVASPVARGRAVWTARRAEPPTMEVASSDGVNSGEETRLHIANLPTTYNKTKIAELVKEVASPVLIKIGHTKKTLGRKRFAFVTMGTVEERDLVIAHLNGKECGSEVLKASVARTSNPRMDKS